MKKFFTLLFSLCLTASIFAQSAVDVIITNDSRKIDARIIEVSKTEIKYKEVSNPDGPTFILSTDEISSVIYSNGTVQVYNNASKQEAPKAENADNNVTILTRDGKSVRGQLVRISDESLTYKSNGVEYTLFADQLDKVAMPDGQIKSYNTSSSLAYTGNNPNLKPLNLYQSYLELGGHFGAVNGFAAGGMQLLDINGIRFNKCFFLGVGTGFLFNYGYTHNDDYASYDLAIPFFADFRAYTPTRVQGLYPFFELGVGTLLHFYTIEDGEEGYAFSRAVGYFRIGAGVEYKRFIFSAGYELWAHKYGRINMGSVRVGVRLGKNPY